MTANDGALGRLLAQVDAGTDCLIEGTRGASQKLFARAAAALACRADVIVVPSPLGELGLSSLIAQISGRPDFNDQDDAVLELGFRRLTAAGPIVLMLEAWEGVGLPTVRYLQHVGRSAPGLVLVVLGSPALDAVLEQPGAMAMRARLRAMPVILADGEGVRLPMPAEAAPLIAEPGPIPLSSPVRRRVRLLPWAAVAVSAAAASVIVVQLSRVPDTDAPVPVITTQTSTVIAPAPAVVEVPLATPAPAVPPVSFPAPAAGPPLPPVTKPDRVLHARRVEAKPRAVARAGRSNPEWRGDDATQYSWDTEPPPWRRRVLRWNEPSYGGYAVDPYGTPPYPFSR